MTIFSTADDTRTMRIGLFIDTDNFGGAESIVLSLATFLAADGHSPVVYCFGNEHLEKACAPLGIPVRRLGARYWYKKTFRVPGFALAFARQLRRDRIEILHSHLFGPIIAGGLAARLSGIAHVGTLHDVYIVQERPARARLLQLVVALGTRLVCVADEMAGYYRDVTGIEGPAIRTITNGVDLDSYGDPGPAGAETAEGAGRRRRATDTGDVRLIMVGRLVALKRHDLLLEALSRLPAGLSWHLDIVGDGPERERLESIRRDKGFGERVTFLGQRGDVASLLADADIFALISDTEGMSLSLVEALASGLPIVATRVGNNAELVRPGINGYLIEPGDAGALAACLEGLLRDPELRHALGAGSRAIAGADLDIRRTVGDYEALYESLVRGSA